MSWIMMKIFAIATVLIFAQRTNAGTYSIIHPKLFRIDSYEVITVNLHGYGNINANVRAEITDYSYGRRLLAETDLLTQRSSTVFKLILNVPRNRFPDNDQELVNRKVQLKVRIEFLNRRHSTINRRIPVYLTGESDYVFVQTDRPIYRPGDTVRIRAVGLNSSMLPRNGNYEMVIKTEEGIGIEKKVGFQGDGFLKYTYIIPPDPPLGSYYVHVKSVSKIHASVGKAEFKIDKYVLPTFNVEIQLDQSTVIQDGTITGNFVAKYTYGEPVVGLYGIDADLHVNGDTFRIFSKPSDPVRKRPGYLKKSDAGRKQFSVPIREATTLSRMTWNELIAAKATVEVTVYVTGSAEAIMEVDNKDGILITDTPYSIDLSRTKKYFIPSATHDVNVIVRDVITKEPVPAIDIDVTYNSRQGEQSLSGRSNDKGTVQVQINTHDIPNIQLQVRAGEAETKMNLVKRESSHGYLKLSGPSYAQIETNINVRAEIMGYSATEIFFVISSRGLIYDSRRKILGSSREFSEAITVTRKMSPGIRVVAYFMNGDHMISDSISIDIDDTCLSKELTVNVSPEQARPAELVQVTVEGEPQAHVGLGGVDTAAYFLNDRGRLDRHQMFEKMKSFDMGCSVGGGVNSSGVFQDAGLSVTTKTSSTSPATSLKCSPLERKRKRRTVSMREDHSVDRKSLYIKCFKDGRKENLADVRCITRRNHIPKLDLTYEELCMEAFYEGCMKGERIRNSSEFTSSMQRSSLTASKLDTHSNSYSPKVRKEFDESWHWWDFKMSRTGTWSQTWSAPSSITTFDIDALSFHGIEGFCVAKPAKLKVFRDFFIQLYLPYSVKVLEQVEIRAALFNYHESKNFTVTLKMETDKALCTKGLSGREYDVGVYTVGRQSSKSITFSVIPLDVPTGGTAKIKMRAVVAGTESLVDGVERNIKIEPAGSLEQFSGQRSLDPRSSAPRPIVLNFPDDGILPNSKKCWVYGFMSRLGPIIEFDPISETPQNLANALRKPDGCGEQNMARVGPNVYAIRYTSHFGNPQESSVEQVKKYIKDGYARQQGHRNKGKWSYGKTSSPTLGLNAYVNKVFLQAKELWSDMDMEPICSSMRWVISQQNRDGSFPASRRYYIRPMDETLHTAYVLISMAESSFDCPDESLEGDVTTACARAADYLRTRLVLDDDTSTYTASIVAYALAVFDSRHSTTITANNRLLNMKVQSGDEIHWQDTSNNAEATAYALLTQVKLALHLGSSVPSSTVDMINSVARWLVNQQNGGGAFKSTQDTVIGIQALTEYAMWIEDLRPPPRDPHLAVTFGPTAVNTSWDSGEEFTLDRNNKHYRKTLEIPRDVVAGTRNIGLSVTGEGQGTLSYRCIYRTTSDQKVCNYSINITTSGNSEESVEGAFVMKLQLSISKNGPDTGMAIVDIGLISGFTPVISKLDAIEKLNKDGGVVDGIIDRYEVTDQKILLYVEKIPGTGNGELKFAILLKQDVKVRTPSPAKILVYDYYKPEDKCSKFYSVPDDSPLIRTHCTTGTETPQECKCFDNGCPKCRTREEQLDRTCPTAECPSIRDSICLRSYGYLIQIKQLDNSSLPTFVNITADVLKKLHDRDIVDDIVKNQEGTQSRNFLLQKQCYDRCRDVGVKSDEAYFTVGAVYLIRGGPPTATTKSNLNTTYDYFMDHEAIIERSIHPDKCEKRRSWEDRCYDRNNTPINTPWCIKRMDKINICYRQRKAEEEIIKGCD